MNDPTLEPERQRMCVTCWQRLYGGATPARVKHDPMAECAFCGSLTASGIYVEQAPLPLQIT